MKWGLRTPGHSWLFHAGEGNSLPGEPIRVEEDPLNPPELARKQKKPESIPFLIVKWLAILLIPMTLISNYLFTRPHQVSTLVPCRNNLKNVATALEMYASDNNGAYPQRLDQLVAGQYLKALPTCPAAGAMTFTDYQVGRNPDNFSMSCVGDNHAKVYGKSAPNYPRYNATEGLEASPPP